MKKNLRLHIFSSFIWRFLEKTGTQGIQFIIQMVLARMLSPKDYGAVALITFFINLANVFVRGGFGSALIQKKDADEIDYSSVFYLSLFSALILYVVLFVFASSIAKFYNMPELENTIKVLALILFIGGINSIQNAIITKEMMYKKLFYSNFGAGIISGVVGIILAYNNFGIWALVFQQLTNTLFISIIFWFTIKWRPSLKFSLNRLKSLFDFGWKLLLSSLIETAYRGLTNLIVGKVYSPAMLGYYNRGHQFPNLIADNFDGSIQAVIFPTLVHEQDNIKRVKEITRRGIMISSYIIFPSMIGLGAIGEPLVRILLTEKWLDCVPFLRIFCLAFSLWPIHTANLQAITAIGRSDVILRLEVTKKIVGIIIIIISVQFGVYAMAIGTLVAGVISSFINASPNKKLLGYSYLEQMKDVLPAFILSLIMGIIVYSISLLKLSDLLIIVLQVFLGAIIYISLSYLFKLECFIYLLKIIKNRGR